MKVNYLSSLCTFLRFCVLSSVFVFGKLCFESTADVSKTVYGKWKESLNISASSFSRGSTVDTWREAACPVEIFSSSCFVSLRRKNVALLAEQREFQTRDCTFKRSSSLELLLELTNRKVYFCCEGMSKQFWIHIVCSLHNNMLAKYAIKWIPESAINSFDKKGCPYGPEHCSFSSASVFYPEYNVTLIYEHHMLNQKMSFRKLDVINIFKSWGLTGNDLMLFNFGHNFHENDDYSAYKRFLKKLADDYEYSATTSRKVLNFLLFMCI